MTDIGCITFGPLVSPEDRKRWDDIERGLGGKTFRQDAPVHACNCIGPQLGEKLCPCMLRAQSEQGRRMVADGVIINGIHYDLVPSKKP